VKAEAVRDGAPALDQIALWALACVAAATVGQMVLTPPPVAGGPHDLPAVSAVRALAQWDAGWYANIADNGYGASFDPGQQSPVAFFPLYPMLIRALSSVGVNKWVAGTGLSFFFGVLAVVIFSRWARRVLPRVKGAGREQDPASLAPWLLAVWPFAGYLFGIMYSDSLFLALACGAFLAVERDRPLLAGGLGLLATLTRPVAPALVVGLLLRSLEVRRASGQRLRKRDFFPLAAGLGLLGYMAFLHFRFQDPLAFANVQGAPGWDQASGWRTWLKLSFFDQLFPRVAPLVALRLVGHALAAFFALALALLTIRRLGWAYGLYCVIAIGLPRISSKDFQGMGRYAMAAFPAFLTLATALTRRPRLARPWVLASAGIALALAFAFGAGGYVA
jgi:hypothetical protein